VNNHWTGGGAGGVFSKVPRSILKSFFQNGDIPTQDRIFCPGGSRMWPTGGYYIFT